MCPGGALPSSGSTRHCVYDMETDPSWTEHLPGSCDPCLWCSRHHHDMWLQDLTTRVKYGWRAGGHMPWWCLIRKTVTIAAWMYLFMDNKNMIKKSRVLTTFEEIQPNLAILPLRWESRALGPQWAGGRQMVKTTIGRVGWRLNLYKQSSLGEIWRNPSKSGNIATTLGIKGPGSSASRWIRVNIGNGGVWLGLYLYK